MERLTEQEILDELAKEHGYQERQPGDVDKFQLAERTGLGPRWCGELLEKKWKSGEMTRFKWKADNGRPLFVYRAKE